MIYAIYKYGLRMEAIGFLDMYMFWHLQFSVSGFAIFGDSLYRGSLSSTLPDVPRGCQPISSLTDLLPLEKNHLYYTRRIFS